MASADIVMAGFGGQGLMAIGKILAKAAMEEGHNVTWMPSYGPEMRGGTANCVVIIDDERPDGRPLPDVPLPPALPADPVRALRARNEAAGFHLHARTTCPGWLGEPLDVGWALDVLHPRALQPLAIDE